MLLPIRGFSLTAAWHKYWKWTFVYPFIGHSDISTDEEPARAAS